MVRKSLIILLASLVAILAMPIATSAANVYDGNISSTYTAIFQDIAEKKVGFNDDYIFYRSGQYTYDLVVGDIESASGQLTSNNVKIYSISTESNYNSSYEYTVTSGSAFTLNPENKLIYSNLGDYPDLIERSVYVQMCIALLLLVIVCLYLLRSIFSFCLRNR